MSFARIHEILFQIDAKSFSFPCLETSFIPKKIWFWRLSLKRPRGFQQIALCCLNFPGRFCRIPHIILELFWTEKQLVTSHYSQDPIIQTIWNEKIVAPYNAVPQIRPVYDGEKVFIDWKSGLEPAIFVRYSTPAGDPLIHVASNPVFMPNYPGKYFF